MPTGAPPRVLVVEDELDVRFALALLLGRAGYDVMLAESGEEGLRLAKERPPALAFVDFRLPGMNGRQVVEALRADERTRDCRIIAASGMLPQDHRMDVEVVLVKPFGPAEVQRVAELAMQLVPA